VCCRCGGTASEAALSDTMSSSTADGLDDFNSFQFWRIQPDVIDNKSVVSACGDSLQALMISDKKDSWTVQHVVGDSAPHRHSFASHDSNQNVNESMFFKCILSFLIA